MKIILYSDIVFADDLTYDQAVQALNQANECTAITDIVRFHVRGKENESTWSLIGRVIELSKRFVSDYEQLIIEIEG